MAIASIVSLCVFFVCVVLLIVFTITSLPMIAATLIDFRRACKAGILLLLIVTLGAIGNIAWVADANSGPDPAELAEMTD
jgi:hypothetical protein